MPFPLPQVICRLVYELVKLVLGSVEAKKRAKHFGAVVTVCCGCRVEESGSFRIKVD